MKICFVGYKNPSFWAVTDDIEMALLEMGHEVQFFDYRSYRLPGRFRERLDWLEAWDRRRINRRLQERIGELRPDLFLVCGGHILEPETIRTARRAGAVAAALLNVVLSLFLVTRAGLPGVLCATAISTAIGYGYFISAFHHHMKMSLASFFAQIYAVPLAGAAAGALTLGVMDHWLSLLVPQADHVRSAALLLLTAKGVLFFLIYGGVVLKARYVAAADWSLLRRAFASTS